MTFKSLSHFDWLLFSAILLLALTGIMMIYSTGLGSRAEIPLWVRQSLALILGIAGLFFLNALDYRFFSRAANVIYVVSLLLLIGVLVFGQEIRGSVRWYNLGFFNFQPAEFSKIALIILLAKFFQVKGTLLKKFRYVLWSGLFVAMSSILLMLQPDLGSAVVHIGIWAGMVIVSQTPRRYLLYIVCIFLIFAAVSWIFFLHDYQKDRIRSFADPTADPTGRGYNVIQSIVAVGSGGAFGTGLARGLQSQLKFLPERQTDFIFASTVEELGFVGGGLVLLLFFLFFSRIIRIIRGSRDVFGVQLATGFFFLVFIQCLINVGMNLGLAPVTGITLPFLSYGGSSLLVTFWSVGILENIARGSVASRFT